MEKKNFLKSKTMLGTLLIVLSMLAPMFGFEFTADEAKTLGGKIGFLLDSASEVIGLIMVVWGRWNADTPLTVAPTPPTTLRSPWFVALLAAVIALSGCAAPLPEDATPLEKIRASYDAAKPLVDVYVSLPACADGVYGLCSKPSVVEKLNQAVALIEGFLATAETSADATPEEKAEAVRQAQIALRTMLAIYVASAVSKT